MKFKPRNGPWQEIFEGSIQDFEVSIHSNPDNVILVSVLEKKKGKIEGTILELYKVFAVEGRLEDFTETFPKEAIVLIKHEAKESLKYFLLSSGPSYVKYEEEQFLSEVDRLYNKLHNSSALVKDVSKAYDIQLEELNKAGEKFKTSFFSLPLLAPILSSELLSGREPRYEMKETGKGGKGEIILGITKDGIAVKEPLSVFVKTTVFGSTGEERKHVIHLIAEGGLISNVAVVIFDWDNSFSGLNKPSSKLKELQEFKVNFEPIGFPVKEFSKEELKVDLNLVNPKGILELFGLMEGEETKFIGNLFKENKVESVNELIEIAKNFSVEESKATAKYRSMRILKLIDVRYPGLFGGTNNIEEIAKNWIKAIGRAGIIHLDKFDERSSLILIHNLIKGILQHYEGNPKSRINAMVLMPEMKKMLPIKSPNILSNEIIELMEKFKGEGICYAISADRPIDLMKEVIDQSEAEIFILSRDDVGIKIANSKQYRLKLRPGLSTCQEK